MFDKYKIDSPADELLKVLDNLKYCGEARDFCKKYAGKTVGEMVNDNPEQSWAVWYLMVLGEKSNTVIRKRMIEHIHDPMMAFQSYLQLHWLTDEEDKLLEAKFKDRLPTAEAELANGIVKKVRV